MSYRYLPLLVMLPWSLAGATQTIDAHRSADSKGRVEIQVNAGEVAVLGWDRAEVSVSGSVGADVDRVDVSGAENRTTISAIQRGGGSWSDSETHLTVHVPMASEVSVSGVSTDVKLEGLRGNTLVQTVSGDIEGDVNGELRANAVSGNVKLAAHSPSRTEVKTISGDVQLTGGAGGEIEITTVSGTVHADLATLTRGRFRSVSGDVSATLGLAGAAQLDAESVSGNLRFDFAAVPDAAFDVQSFSGDIDSCFGPAPVKARYGPGSRLSFDSREAHGHVRMDTKSGDVTLCAKGASH